MIKNNLSVLLAERDITAAEVSKDTGISKTTLTSLVNNTGKGIQFDTINTLCKYLKIEPKNFFLYTKYDYEIKDFEETGEVYFSNDQQTGEQISAVEFFKMVIFFDDGVLADNHEFKFIYEYSFINKRPEIIELYIDDSNQLTRSERTLQSFINCSPELFVTQFLRDIKHYIESKNKISFRVDRKITLKIFDRTISLDIKPNN